MKPLVILLALGFATASPPASQEMPSELARLAAGAQLEGTVTLWCGAEFRPGYPGAFAVAVISGRVGRYVALDTDGSATGLGPFDRIADLRCYSRAQAEALNVSISQSETIHGDIAPRWNTTVVCGFIEATAAECWQYSPVDRAFVRVGQWVT